jgi:hypothetical protein
MQRKVLAAALLAIATVAAIRPVALAAQSNAKTAELAAKEKELWDTFGSKKPAAFGALLAPDFEYISDGGLTDATELLKLVPRCDQRNYSFDHLQVLDSGPDSGVVLVHVKTDTVCDGEKTAPAFYAASTWVKRSGKWLLLVHTETDDPPPAPAR